MEGLIDDAVKAGARIATGGESGANRGFFWQPTVLADVPETARIMNEEPFGPIAVVRRIFVHRRGHRGRQPPAIRGLPPTPSRAPPPTASGWARRSRPACSASTT